jgi:hypothetical protein
MRIGPSAWTIQKIVATWQRTLTTLAGDPELREDEAAIRSALMSDPKSVHPDDLLERIVTAISFCTARTNEANDMIEVLQKRQARYRRRLATLRQEAADLLKILKYRRYRALLGTVTLRTMNGSLLITDEEAIPPEYFETKKILLRKKLFDDLAKNGVVVNGAYLSSVGATVSINGLKPPRETTLGETEDDGDDSEFLDEEEAPHGTSRPAQSQSKPDQAQPAEGAPGAGDRAPHVEAGGIRRNRAAVAAAERPVSGR